MQAPEKWARGLSHLPIRGSEKSYLHKEQTQPETDENSCEMIFP